eukprot:CAMPEP_0185011820 /NCGR_PEP_ID=MMETSP1098-20130426/97983_1 /TAXON_ID=89044 /ORGANISM="Spumella elongata, Strain CCAP 955/1" /LENGTH=211 /DNA_ID=CAMNT_0027540861 /DNA_START=67 /DNA_END=702 /DNA_ORIENTATION=+
MMFSVICTFLAVTSAVFASNLRSGKVNPDTVASLDVPKYLGLWYQMAADKIVLSTFQKDSFCATAVYGDNGDGTLSVHNYATIGSPAGSPYTIDGYGYQTNPDTYPGQLKVVLEGPDASPYPAPYWILELGPVNTSGYYDWAIVSDSFSSTLFVLARDPATFNAQYKESVYTELTKLGFTGYSAPIDVYQGVDCVYESTRRHAQMKNLDSK